MRYRYTLAKFIGENSPHDSCSGSGWIRIQIAPRSGSIFEIYGSGSSKGYCTIKYLLFLQIFHDFHLILKNSTLETFLVVVVMCAHFYSPRRLQLLNRQPKKMIARHLSQVGTYLPTEVVPVPTYIPMYRGGPYLFTMHFSNLVK